MDLPEGNAAISAAGTIALYLRCLSPLKREGKTRDEIRERVA
jgi:hypothetical protein